MVPQFDSYVMSYKFHCNNDTRSFYLSMYFLTMFVLGIPMFFSSDKWSRVRNIFYLTLSSVVACIIGPNIGNIYAKIIPCSFMFSVNT